MEVGSERVKARERLTAPNLNQQPLFFLGVGEFFGTIWGGGPSLEGKAWGVAPLGMEKVSTGRATEKVWKGQRNAIIGSTLGRDWSQLLRSRARPGRRPWARGAAHEHLDSTRPSL